MRTDRLINEGLNRQDEDARRTLSKRLRKRDAKLLFKRLRDARAEKDVEDAWKEIFSDFYIKNNNSNDNFTISSPFNTDGFISMDESSLVFALRILMEFKNKTDLRKSYDRCRIAAQIIHYMYNFKTAGYELPTVLVGADESQVFILLAANFYKYLNGDYNWKCSPSSAYKEDINLMNDLQLDANMSVFPFQITLGSFEQRYNSLLDVFESIQSIVQDNDHDVYRIKVTPANILSMFDQFSTIAYRKQKSISPVESVNIFMQMLTGIESEKYFFNPANHNLFHLPGDHYVEMYGNRVEAFFNHYDRNLQPSEIDVLKSIADRLIEANERRYKGDFWTPSIWAHRADELLCDEIDENYKNECIVWDCAAGVRNLTRDFSYNELYISTYHQAEVMLGDGYNPEAKAAFQYDFLNDDVDLNPTDNPNPDEWKLPNELFYALQSASKENKKIVFYTNPPYGTANNVGGNGTSKSGISKNKMNIYMKDNDYGAASQQLYAQFFARIIKLVSDFKLTNVSIGFFTKSRFFTGGDYWKKFNEHLFGTFKFKKGIYLNSGEFNDTSDTWPVTFSIYDLKNNKSDINQSKFTFNIEESQLDQDNKLYIQPIGNHTTQFIYSNNSLRKWAGNIKSKDYMKTPYPQLSSALNIATGKRPAGKLINHSLGYEVSNSNNIGEGILNSGVWIVSGSAYKGHGFNVIDENFDRAVVNFTARRCVEATWINDPDNYAIPNTKSDIYNEFVNDSIIFALFDNASYQAAYRGNDWSNTNIPNKWANQWFWLSKEHMQELANAYNNNEIYQDVRNDNERFVYKQIQQRSFSNEALDVLNSATNVLNDTFKFRNSLNDDDPDLYLNAWDAGWFQIKQINSIYHVQSYDKFHDSFKLLKSKLSKNVYKLGMLND